MRAPGEGNDFYLKYFIGIYFISVAEATCLDCSASYPCSTWGCLGGSSLRSGSVCADARRPREGAARQPPAHRPAPSRSCHRLGVKVPSLPAPLRPGSLAHCRHVNTGLVLVSEEKVRKQNIQENVLFSFLALQRGLWDLSSQNRD